MDRFSWNIYQFCLQQQLIQNKKNILISVSGGSDSMCLARVLINFQEKLDISLHCIHFHHGIRKESDDEEEFVRNFAQQNEMPCYIHKHTQMKNIKGMQNSARKWRFQKIQICKIENKIDTVATGHHLDDLIETQLWKITRGCSLLQLSPLKPKENHFIRPLLHTTKRDIINYLSQNHHQWKEDLSNQNNDYTRNIIRNSILPLLYQNFGFSLRKKMLAIAQESIELENLYYDATQKIDKNKNNLPYSYVWKLPPLFAKTLIHNFLLQQTVQSILRNQIENIYQLTMSNKGNWRVELHKGFVALGKLKKIIIITK